MGKAETEILPLQAVWAAALRERGSLSPCNDILSFQRAVPTPYTLATSSMRRNPDVCAALALPDALPVHRVRGR